MLDYLLPYSLTLQTFLMNYKLIHLGVKCEPQIKCLEIPK